ncbi:MAG: hypothetical protein KDA75_07090 [Planctomycetaceae bacterium]|nr:hypothetical protein [Planctomycetaceae bacterium]
MTSAGGTADDKARPEAKADDAPPAATELQAFMRKKLEASNQILEGLTTDDLGMVKDGARQLNELSRAERWRVSNDPIYRQFSGDFRETTQQLIKAAEDGNADRAAMKWMDATISCLDCHRFVRGMHVARE